MNILGFKVVLAVIFGFYVLPSMADSQLGEHHQPVVNLVGMATDAESCPPASIATRVVRVAVEEIVDAPPSSSTDESL